jgi:hypothetical protein
MPLSCRNSRSGNTRCRSRYLLSVRESSYSAMVGERLWLLLIDRQEQRRRRSFEREEDGTAAALLVCASSARRSGAPLRGEGAAQGRGALCASAGQGGAALSSSHALEGGRAEGKKTALKRQVFARGGVRLLFLCAIAGLSGVIRVVRDERGVCVRTQMRARARERRKERAASVSPLSSLSLSPPPSQKSSSKNHKKRPPLSSPLLLLFAPRTFDQAYTRVAPHTPALSRKPQKQPSKWCVLLLVSVGGVPLSLSFPRVLCFCKPRHSKRARHCAACARSGLDSAPGRRSDAPADGRRENERERVGSSSREREERGPLSLARRQTSTAPAGVIPRRAHMQGSSERDPLPRGAIPAP